MASEAKYDRDLLINTLVYHQRKSISGCTCGWAELGLSHPAHVADEYETTCLSMAGTESEAEYASRHRGYGSGGKAQSR